MIRRHKKLSFRLDRGEEERYEQLRVQQNLWGSESKMQWSQLIRKALFEMWQTARRALPDVDRRPTQNPVSDSSPATPAPQNGKRSRKGRKRGAVKSRS